MCRETRTPIQLASGYAMIKAGTYENVDVYLEYRIYEGPDVGVGVQT